jgi:hypothetical protein
LEIVLASGVKRQNRKQLKEIQYMKSHKTNFLRVVNSYGLRILIVTLLLAVWAIDGLAQRRVMECGARIVSQQPFGNERLCLFVPDTQDRTKVALRPCTPATSDPGFLWKIIRRDGGGLYITSATSGQERRMEVADYNKRNGGAIQMWGPNEGNGYRSQTWDFFPVGTNAMIVGVDSGLCMAVPLGSNRLDQEFLIQFNCSTARNFLWQVEPVRTGAERNDCR